MKWYRSLPMANGENPSSADNQQETPWIAKNQELLQELDELSEKLVRSTRHNKGEISELVDQLRDTAIGIDVLSPEHGETHISALTSKINNRLSPLCDYLP